MLPESGVCRCKVQHTIKATAASPDTNNYGYTDSFIYSDAQFCLISNHFAVFLAVGGTWWPAMLRFPGMVYVP
jgi:hypothetical protein